MSEKVESQEAKKPRKPKSTTTKSTTTKAKAKEEVVESVAPQPQMTPDMMAMFAQFAQFMQMQQQGQAVAQPVAEEKKTARIKKPMSTEKGLTKQAVRRKWKNTEVYLTSVVPGTICYKSKNDIYEWDYLGDSQPVTIEDVIAMPDSYLKTPLLEISEVDNDEEMLDDLISCLGLESMYEHLYVLGTLENDIENTDMEKLKKVLAISKNNGHDLVSDVTAIIQSKIDNKELQNYHAIAEFEKALGRSFNR